MPENALLELRRISKQYPGVLALDDISVTFKTNEIHALVGENGAGKSTLIKVLSGAISPDKGEIVFEGITHIAMTPKLSRDLGIAVIYQEFNLVPALTVAENVFVGSMPGNKVFIDRQSCEKKTVEIFQRMKINIDPKSLVRDLTVAYKQMVEIAKALSKNVRILVMDEPTAPLTSKETDILLEIVENLKKQGVTIIFITHRLDEVFRIADRITVMRDGCFAGEMDPKNTTRDDLIRSMVGRHIADTYPVRTSSIGEPVLEVAALNGAGIEDIDFVVRRGEILGFAGLVGAGRTETMRFLFGADKKKGGTIVFKGEDIEIKTPRESVRRGIGLIPEDRKQQGVILGFPIRWNVSLAILEKLSKYLLLNHAGEKKTAEQLRVSLDIKTQDIMQITRNLSGGNQQKVALAKWLAAECEVLIFDEPTRGIDVGARYEIYKLMNELCAQGKAIIMVSSDMEELLGMSDRIVVLCEGRKTGELNREQFSQETVLRLASGVV
ncbi:MAG: sugar ABC transporter ATP-binding protein [Treponema sp.]|jgi:ABC-type sugar transport system ATPase subunit|nr:sugar ABC transporter ATP-binding protein [Treponema sp.]